VIFALAVLVGSAVLVAVTVTPFEPLTVSGAVYNPVLEIDPVDGLKDQVTDVSLALLTDASNCCVCEALTPAVPGVTVIDTAGFNVTVALALFVGSAMLVAVTVTVCALLILEGAV